MSESDDTDSGNDPSTGVIAIQGRWSTPEEAPTTGSLLGEALDLITAMLADLVGASAADPDDFVDDLDRLSQMPGPTQQTPNWRPGALICALNPPLPRQAPGLRVRCRASVCRSDLHLHDSGAVLPSCAWATPQTRPAGVGLLDRAAV